MPKIGKDALQFTPQKIRVDKVLTNSGLIPIYKERILAVLNNSVRPLNITELQRLCEVRSWITTKQALTELEVEGKVEHFRMGRYVLFRLKKVKKKREQRLPRISGQITLT